MDVEAIKGKMVKGRYVIAFTHTEKLRQRKIAALDIEQAVKAGSIIEEYPLDFCREPVARSSGVRECGVPFFDFPDSSHSLSASCGISLNPANSGSL